MPKKGKYGKLTCDYKLTLHTLTLSGGTVYLFSHGTREIMVEFKLSHRTLTMKGTYWLKIKQTKKEYLSTNIGTYQELCLPLASPSGYSYH